MGAGRNERGAAGTFLLMAVVLALAAVVAVVNIGQPDDEALDQVQLGRATPRTNDVADAARQSLLSYWARELPAVYQQDFEALAGGFQPKTPDSPAFSCGGQTQTYEDLRGNAFYCGGSDDYIAWDAATLFPQLSERYGGIAPAIVLAHEVGHAVQARAGIDAPSVVQELQADCFAGSWTRFAETSTEDPVSLSDGALDSAVATVLTLRDQPGRAATAPQAHGLGFDRVNAFQTGYEQGAGRCAKLPTEGVVTTELPFRTQAEAETGGDLPFEQAVQVLTDSLDSYWTAVLPRLADGGTFQPPTVRPADSTDVPECPSGQDPTGLAADYCPASTTIDWSVPRLLSVHEQIGDLGTGAALGDAWAEAAQNQAGLETAGQRAGLQRDCFTGAWIASLAGENLARSPLSPGDLDEALTAIVAASFTDDARSMDRGGAFARTRSLRTGLFENLSGCV
ncbi:protein of unknown function zinc metallopeptidase putative [Kribbella flavida DSM 17836]|uniref:Metalloprotease n=1 Tax=Kribbella flavida (strain DSM 17836 / JCM 10339 / NBRC 14399) TaxID=479435 RepID=D2PNV8_KRIFD|nr:neutral zinc metallopeptidase [Kribbella flavida]ADB32776.1 protein of unknown function zinc metallopeptidase putative [Kribbella flavida DSM 17836]